MTSAQRNQFGYHKGDGRLRGEPPAIETAGALESTPPLNNRISDRELRVLCLLAEDASRSDREIGRVLDVPSFAVAAARARTRRAGLWRTRYELHPDLDGATPRVVAWGKAANVHGPADLEALRAAMEASSASGLVTFRNGMFFAVLLPGDLNQFAPFQAALLDLRTRETGEFLFLSYDSLEFIPGPQVQRVFHHPAPLIARLLTSPVSAQRPLSIGRGAASWGQPPDRLGQKQLTVLFDLLSHPDRTNAETGKAVGLTTHSVAHIKSRLVSQQVLRASFQADLAALGYPYVLFVGRAHRPIPFKQNWRYLREIGGLHSDPVTYCFSPTASAAFFPFRSLEAARAGERTYLAQCDELQMRCTPHAYISPAAGSRSVGYSHPGDLFAASLAPFHQPDGVAGHKDRA